MHTIFFYCCSCCCRCRCCQPLVCLCTLSPSSSTFPSNRIVDVHSQRTPTHTLRLYVPCMCAIILIYYHAHSPSMRLWSVPECNQHDWKHRSNCSKTLKPAHYKNTHAIACSCMRHRMSFTFLTQAPRFQKEISIFAKKERKTNCETIERKNSFSVVNCKGIAGAVCSGSGSVYIAIYYSEWNEE